jgi:hypothetical protein
MNLPNPSAVSSNELVMGNSANAGGACPLIQPENLAHHGTASSLNYKDWDSNDVLGWLEEHLKLP